MLCRFSVAENVTNFLMSSTNSAGSFLSLIVCLSSANLMILLNEILPQHFLLKLFVVANDIIQGSRSTSLLIYMTRHLCQQDWFPSSHVSYRFVRIACCYFTFSFHRHFITCVISQTFHYISICHFIDLLLHVSLLQLEILVIISRNDRLLQE